MDLGIIQILFLDFLLLILENGCPLSLSGVLGLCALCLSVWKLQWHVSGRLITSRPVWSALLFCFVSLGFVFPALLFSLDFSL